MTSIVFLGHQVRNRMDMMGQLVGMSEAPEPARPSQLERLHSSGLEPRTKLEPVSAEYAQIKDYFTSSLTPSEAHRCRIEMIEKLHVPDIKEQ